ncbi:MAG: HAD family hydrolase [Planctomycetota bacterium]
MGNKITTIVLDIDGTLIPAGGKVSEEDAESLMLCRQDGIQIYVATARPPHLVFRPGEVPECAGFLGDSGVFYGGALARDPQVEYRRTHMVGAATVARVVRCIEDRREGAIQVVVQRPGKKHAFLRPVPESMLQGWGIDASDVVEFGNVIQKPCLRLTIFHTEAGKRLTGIGNQLLKIVESKARVRRSREDEWLEVLSAQATKERAVRELMEWRHTSPETVVVFGNDKSDLGLFDACGVSVAPKDASSKLRGKASYVTCNCAENAVARGLEELNII